MLYKEDDFFDLGFHFLQSIYRNIVYKFLIYKYDFQFSIYWLANLSSLILNFSINSYLLFNNNNSIATNFYITSI